MNDIEITESSQWRLLASRKLAPLFATQFTGAFNFVFPGTRIFTAF
ncbi:MAG: hypothetical protein P8Y45_24400 [Exilibacterium sp.]